MSAENGTNGGGIKMPEMLSMPEHREFEGQLSEHQISEIRSKEMRFVIFELSKVVQAVQWVGNNLVDLNNIHVRGVIERENRRRRRATTFICWLGGVVVVAVITALARYFIG